MGKQYIASYDFGTSGVKAVLVGVDGRVASHATSNYPLLTPKVGWAEQEPEKYWEAVCKATGEAVRKAEIDPADVIGVVFGTMWKGVIPIDKEGNALHNCIIWLDARAEKQAKELNERMGTDRFCAQDYWTKLMWLKEEHPDLYEQADCILENNSYLKFKATGKKGVDLCNCMVTSTKPALKEEYESIMAAAGLDQEKFPPCMMPWENLGGLTEKAAGELGLVEGTPVFGGFGDIPAITIGSGSSAMDAAHIYLGSSGWLGVTAADRIPGAGEAYQPLDNEKEILLYTMQSACMSFDWTIRQFYHSEWKSMGGGVYDLVAEELESVGPGSNGLLAAPWLHGERPPLSEKARGLFLNIDASHERKHFVSAMQESICYMLRMKLEKYAKETGKKIEKINVVGGGTASNHWMQALADILGIPVDVPADSRHAGAIGTAYCALIGLGRCADFEAANELLKIEKHFEPREEVAAAYDKLYECFSELFPVLRTMFEKLNG